MGLLLLAGCSQKLSISISTAHQVALLHPALICTANKEGQPIHQQTVLPRTLWRSPSSMLGILLSSLEQALYMFAERSLHDILGHPQILGSMLLSLEDVPYLDQCWQLNHSAPWLASQESSRKLPVGSRNCVTGIRAVAE